jgi:hypothetical protein
VIGNEGRRKRSRRGLSAAAGLALVALLALPASAAASTRSTTVTVPGFDAGVGVAKATCPRHQRATGGGFVTASDSIAVMLVFESRKIGQRSWRVSAADKDTPQTLTAFVYCDKDAVKTKEKLITVTAPAGSGLVAADASCGSAGRAQAGGFVQPLVPPTYPNQADMVDSFRSSKKSWRSRMSPAFGTGTPSLTTYVYCADVRAPKARSGSVTSSTNGERLTALSADCQHHTHPFAGGFSQPNATTSDVFILPFQSFRSGKHWQVSARHNGSASTTLNSIAYCA